MKKYLSIKKTFSVIICACAFFAATSCSHPSNGGGSSTPPYENPDTVLGRNSAYQICFQGNDYSFTIDLTRNDGSFSRENISSTDNSGTIYILTTSIDNNVYTITVTTPGVSVSRGNEPVYRITLYANNDTYTFGTRNASISNITFKAGPNPDSLSTINLSLQNPQAN